MIRFCLVVFMFPILLSGCTSPSEEKSRQEASLITGKNKFQTEPLSSWNDSENKSRILEFVKSVTEEGPSFVKEEDRIAVFDNDGTLWVEQPIYTQLVFAIDQVKALAPQHPEWKNEEPYKSILQGELDSALAGDKKKLMEILMETSTGMTTLEFSNLVSEWIDTARHPELKRPYLNCVYQPMLELMDYLKANGFKVFIVSGGGVEFMRPWTADVYGVPSEQVIGSSIKTKYEVKEGNPVLIRVPEINFIDNKEGKPVGINEHIGKRPIAAFGNSDGDFQMLEWATSGDEPGLGLIVNHDDANGNLPIRSPK